MDFQFWQCLRNVLLWPCQKPADGAIASQESTTGPLRPALHNTSATDSIAVIDIQPTGTPNKSASYGAPSAYPDEERYISELLESDPEAISDQTQRRLATLIRNRGYHVKEHVPKKVLENQIVTNIQKREKIAKILRQQEAKHYSQRNLVHSLGGEVDSQQIKDSKTLLEKIKRRREISVATRDLAYQEYEISTFVQDCVTEHNRLRAHHGSPPLALSSELCKEAQKWANQIAHFHALQYEVNGKGENILTCPMREGLTGASIVRAWYETGRSFKYGINDLADLAHGGPFSQIIWKSTTKVGIGISRNIQDGRVTIVVRYDPPGNTGGHFSANVPPPLKGAPPPTVATISRTREEAHLYVQHALTPLKLRKRAAAIAKSRHHHHSIAHTFESALRKRTGKKATTYDALVAPAPTEPSVSHITSNGSHKGPLRLLPICSVCPAYEPRPSLPRNSRPNIMLPHSGTQAGKHSAKSQNLPPWLQPVELPLESDVPNRVRLSPINLPDTRLQNLLKIKEASMYLSE